MITFANTALLAESLKAAEVAHKASGDPADSWANWYANWLAMGQDARQRMEQHWDDIAKEDVSIVNDE